jgi:hypothetical protein
MSFISSIFSKEARRAKAFKKNLKQAINNKIQSEERFQAMIELAKNGSEDAIYGLLKRFTVVAESKGGIVVDEEEKKWLKEIILEFGEIAIPALRRFILAKEGYAVAPVHSISQSLQLIKKIKNGDEKYLFEMVKELVEANPPGYERDPVRKEEIITYLNEWKYSGLSELIVPYLEDMSETIRFITVECLFNQDEVEICREPLLGLFLPDVEDSLRIHNRILTGFSEKLWSIKGYRSYVDEKLPSELYSIQRGDKIIKNKGSR